MLTYHDDLEFAAGDEWVISGLLLDADGAPLDLDPAVTLGWTLIDGDGKTVAGLNTVTLAREEPVSEGKVTISVPEDLTRALEPGRYMDAIRAWIDGAPSLMWRGTISVAVDPFHSEITS